MTHNNDDKPPAPSLADSLKELFRIHQAGDPDAFQRAYAEHVARVRAQTPPPAPETEPPD